MTGARRRVRADPTLRLTTMHQPELNGTAGAMLLGERFRPRRGGLHFRMGRHPDGRGELCALHAKRARSQSYDLMLSINRVRDPWRGGAVYVDADMRVERLVEKPARGPRRRIGTMPACSPRHRGIFDYLAKLKPSPRGELELPQAIAMMIDDRCEVLAVDVRGFWSDVGTPKDLASARKLFKPPHRR